eukprot:2402635-Rhodomonas_salina.3
MATNAAQSESAEIAALLTKMQELQEKNNELQKEIGAKDEKVASIIAEKRKEMLAFMDGIKQFVDTLNIKGDDEDKKRFLQGIERIANTGETNPIFEVMCQASAVHSQNVNKYESLLEEHESLKKKMVEGQFSDHDSRFSGQKRSAEDISEGNKDMGFWDEFTGFMKHSA